MPDGVSIVGFDDITMAGWDVFNLTTIHADLEGLAAGSCELLLRRMSNSHAPARRTIVPVELVLRRTHAEPPRRR